jgi:hypothetical protein
MLRWRQDKPVAEADTLETLRELLPQTSRQAKPRQAQDVSSPAKNTGDKASEDVADQAIPDEAL